jgi:hypothetical protein
VPGAWFSAAEHEVRNRPPNTQPMRRHNRIVLNALEGIHISVMAAGHRFEVTHARVLFLQPEFLYG